MTESKVIQIVINPVHFFPIGSFLLRNFSLEMKILRFQFWKKISPTLDPFQAIGIEKNVNQVFLWNGGGKGAEESLHFNPVQPHIDCNTAVGSY